jgi:superfamily I DNA/RNA helicase
MAFTPTSEQLAIVQAAQSSSDNLCVTALAGAAKTSTLVLIAEALPDTQILCLAFNKKIALEMTERLPTNCKAMTLNALGHRTWMDATGRKMKLETSKVYDILTALVEAEKDRELRSTLYENFGEILRVIQFGKQCGYVPTDHFDRAKRLMDDEEFFDHIEQELSPEEEKLVREVTLTSIEQAMKGVIDFDDQIFMPTIFHGAFPRYPLVLIDEAQDLSALNHATLRKLAKKRLIAVGDPNQAIYGFRGAHENSMSLLRQEFSMQVLPLSISFRCPRAIVEHVKWKTPTMQFPDWARAGEVTTLPAWSTDDLPNEAAIICRNNAPLFSIAIRLLKNGRHAEIAGNDTAKGLIKIMRKFGGSDLKQLAVLDKIANWEEAQKTKNKKRAHNNIADRAECMRIFARQGQNLGEALAYAQHLIQSIGPLKLMTGHKAKGLEFDHVFFLNQDLVSERDQDPNLRYVIQTRAKETLTYINSADFVDRAGMALDQSSKTIPEPEQAA